MEHPGDDRLIVAAAPARGRMHRWTRSATPTGAAPRIGSRRLWFRILIAIVVLALLWSAAWFYVPALIVSQASKAVEQQLGRRLTLGHVAFNPWTLELTVDDLALAGASASAPPMLEIKRLHADAALISLFRLAPVIDALEIDAPMVRVARVGDGRFDFDDVLQRLAAAPPSTSKEPARFSVHNIVVRAGSVDFDDRPLATVHRVRDLELGVPLHQLAAVAARDQGRAAPRAHRRRQPLRLGRQRDAVRRARQRRAAREDRGLRRRALPRLLAARPAGAAARRDPRRRSADRVRAAAQALAQRLGQHRRRRPEGRRRGVEAAARSRQHPGRHRRAAAARAARARQEHRRRGAAALRGARRARPRQPAARGRDAVGRGEAGREAAVADCGLVAPADRSASASARRRLRARRRPRPRRRPGA